MYLVKLDKDLTLMNKTNKQKDNLNFFGLICNKARPVEFLVQWEEVFNRNNSVFS